MSNLPPGCSVRDIPGNSKEDLEAEAVYDAIYEELAKVKMTDDEANALAEWIYDSLGDAYSKGYQEGMSDADSARDVRGDDR